MPDLGTLIGAAGGLTGVVSLVHARATRRKINADADQIIARAAGDITGSYSALVAQLESRLASLEETVKALSQDVEECHRERRELLRSVAANSQPQ